MSDAITDRPNGCPREDELVRLIEGALAADALARLEAHVDGCERCAAVLGELGARGARGGSRTVDRYQLDRRIAAGGMGEVWAAWDPKLRRDVAVKLVRPDRADESRERDRLLREARALARLTHPNVIAVYDVGEHDGEVFIVTDLVVGDTLANRGGAAADWPTVVSLYAQAARGLAAAHAGGLVHRDVKPANLLVGADGRVRVADFGLAIKTAPSPSVGGAPAAVSDVWRVTRPGAIAGTPAYMAPEQRLGQAVEAPADQFALCTALGEAIAGRRPTADITPAALHAFVCERRTDAPGLASLCEVIARGLAFEATGRHANMTALADSLEAIGDGRRPATRPADVALAATGTALAATSAALGDTRDSTPPARTDGPRARTPSTGPETIGDTLLPARPGSSGDGCRAPSDRGGVRRDAPSTDRGGSQRADSGRGDSSRADSGRADSGRADSGRADSGHADSGRGDSSRGDSSRGARTPETTRPPLTSSDEAAREHAGAGARGRGTAVTAPPPLDPRAASDDDGPAGERRGLLRGAAIVIGAAALGGLGVWWMLRAREVAPPPSAAAQDSVAAASATTTPAIAPTAAPAPAAMTASDPTAAALSAPGAATAPGTATAAIRTRTGTPPGAATSAIRTGTGSRPTPPSPATRAAPAQVTGLPTPATAAPATAAPATAAPSPTAPSPTAPSPAGGTTLDDVRKAILKFDGKGCRAALATLSAPPPSDIRVQSSMAVCTMIAGDCDEGTRQMAAVTARQGSGNGSLAIMADLYCPLTSDPETRLRRLARRLDMFHELDCQMYLRPLRESAKIAESERDRRLVGSLLNTVAKCFSFRGDCDRARDILGEAQVFIPALALDELASACR